MPFNHYRYFFNLDMISKSTGSKQAHFNWLKTLKSICKSEEAPKITSNDETKYDCEKIQNSKDFVVLDSFPVQRQMEASYISLKETTIKIKDEISDMKKELNALKTAQKQMTF